jgi:hypothetical protein
MGRALLVGFGLAERLSASALRLSYLCGDGDAGLSAVSGAGRHLLLSRKFTGAATEYASSACGCASRGGADDETGTAFSYRRLGGSARSHAFDCMDAGGRATRDRVEMTGLRPLPLPHHGTCGFPHPAVEPGDSSCRKIGWHPQAPSSQARVVQDGCSMGLRAKRQYAG